MFESWPIILLKAIAKIDTMKYNKKLFMLNKRKKRITFLFVGKKVRFSRCIFHHNLPFCGDKYRKDISI